MQADLKVISLTVDDARKIMTIIRIFIILNRMRVKSGNWHEGGVRQLA